MFKQNTFFPWLQIFLRFSFPNLGFKSSGTSRPHLREGIEQARLFPAPDPSLDTSTGSPHPLLPSLPGSSAFRKQRNVGWDCPLVAMRITATNTSTPTQPGCRALSPR